MEPHSHALDRRTRVAFNVCGEPSAEFIQAHAFGELAAIFRLAGLCVVNKDDLNALDAYRGEGVSGSLSFSQTRSTRAGLRFILNTLDGRRSVGHFVRVPRECFFTFCRKI